MKNKETKVLQFNFILEDPVQGFTLLHVLSVQGKSESYSLCIAESKIAKTALF